MDLQETWRCWTTRRDVPHEAGPACHSDDRIVEVRQRQGLEQGGSLRQGLLRDNALRWYPALTPGTP